MVRERDAIQEFIPAVTEFRRERHNDEAINKQALDLVKKLNVALEDSDTSKALSKNAAVKLDERSKLSSA
jgi:predicted outer membrane protein